MKFSRKHNLVVVFTVLLPLFLYLFFVPVLPKYFGPINEGLSLAKPMLQKFYSEDLMYQAASLVQSSVNIIKPTPAPKKLENPPAVVKAVYLTGWSAGSKNYLVYLNKLIETTQVNAVVIDVKDYSGIVSYRTGATQAKAYKAYWPQISNIDALVNHLHEKGIYVIGRVVVFEDPVLAKNRPDLAVYDSEKTQDLMHPVFWEDNSKLYWVDPSSQDVYDYNIAIAKDALAHGFDEINFDYVRFPTGSNAKNMEFPLWDKKIPRNVVIKNFFKKVRQELPRETLSVDLFGQATSNTDDLGIGQILEDAFEYFDYVSPMVYPSHFAKGFKGYQNPTEHPYEVMLYSMETALKRQTVYQALQKAKSIGQDAISTASSKVPVIHSKLRPWIQDFTLGKVIYDKAMVEYQMQASQDALGEQFAGFMLWNPSNVYTKEALQPALEEAEIVMPN